MLSKIILLPIIAGLVSQGAKFFISSNNYEMELKNFMSYSGMPSSHAAIVASLTTIAGLVEGLDSPIFAISLILAIIVIRDALGIRRYLGQHSHVINLMVKELKNDKLLYKKYPHLLEKIGHTPAQVVAGSIIGFLISLIGYYL